MLPTTTGHFLNEGKDRDASLQFVSIIQLSLEVKSSTLQGVTEQSKLADISITFTVLFSAVPQEKTETVKDRESAWRAGGVLACQGTPAKTSTDERNEEKNQLWYFRLKPVHNVKLNDT